MDRLVTLSKIIDALEPIKGEKSLQKLVYLIQANGERLGYQFKWNNYGPISFDLDRDIQELQTLGLITIAVQDRIPVYTGIDSRAHLSDFWRRQLVTQTLSERSQRIISFINSLGDRRDDPLFLEVLASLDYLQRHTTSDPITQYQGVSGDRCPSELISAAHTTLQDLQVNH